ncbi:hypothetical protein GUITHDRAFT_135227 [Guillardia theta CCMP2712]|uniref:Uncharacterized protein n=1 Tax=Guillardia theta (strain CCMP2712) TaxID=905079 RepID=L1JR77_GUITC|nr:hypothetical protein GUITHDRAFT_135227 [Guillardia theta CCMP2712]EKX50598.1 hypothetical protein GUITHDRAFT_135227 [Guillardia theta CCMP2712]|eukprot:XP_005837578.1 hypothetical protein GUITHDRAFT_135227 [Guillardia theta CCMP2712]
MARWKGELKVLGIVEIVMILRRKMLTANLASGGSPSIPHRPFELGMPEDDEAVVHIAASRLSPNKSLLVQEGEDASSNEAIPPPDRDLSPTGKEKEEDENEEEEEEEYFMDKAMAVKAVLFTKKANVPSLWRELAGAHSQAREGEGRREMYTGTIDFNSISSFIHNFASEASR